MNVCDMLSSQEYDIYVWILTGSDKSKKIYSNSIQYVYEQL